MSVKNYFAAANSGSGFVNLFDNVICREKSGFAYVLKGGPGTGKNTLMRKIGEHFLARGENIEYFYCSSDVKSLDGVRLADHNICVLDGTAPHVTEAETPSARDKIINIGAAIGNGISRYLGELNALAGQKKDAYKKAYAYIEAAAKISELNYRFAENNKNFGEIGGTARRLFLSVSDDKTASFVEANGYAKIVDVESEKDKTADGALLDTAKKLMSSGKECIFLLNPLLPRLIDFFEDRTENVLYARKKAPSESDDYAEAFIAKAFAELERARKIHKEIEAYYRQFTDFRQLDEHAKSLIEEIEKRISN